MIKKNYKLINGSQAINDGLIQAGKKNKKVIFLAEGISDPSYVYGTTKNLFKLFGANRVIEIPLSENALTGVAIGSAMNGMRPILNFHRVEFALLAIEQLFNNAAKAHYISAGKHKVPFVLRLVVGRGWGQGPEHSQVLEGIFAMIPGLKVIMPTFPNDSKGMLIKSIEDDNPVIFIEHRWNHYIQENVKLGYFTKSINGPRLINKGNDITIVSTSYMTIETINAIKHLKKISVSVDHFDLRVLRPLKINDIKKSVCRTGRLITVDTGFKMFGIGSEIISQVVEDCFKFLKYPPLKLGLPDHPIPSSRGYLENIYPNSLNIFLASLKILNLKESKFNKEIKNLKNEISKLSIDVPNPKFKGPF